MEAEETKEAVKTFTQEDINGIVETRLARERTKTEEVISGLTARLDERDAERKSAQDKLDEEAKSKLSTGEHVKALQAQVEKMASDLVAKDQASELNSLNNASKDVMVADGLDPKFSKFALGELESMRTVTGDGVFYRDAAGIAMSQDEALASVKATYPEWFSANRSSGATLPVGQGGSEADRSTETIDQFRARRESEGRNK